MTHLFLFVYTTKLFSVCLVFSVQNVAYHAVSRLFVLPNLFLIQLESWSLHYLIVVYTITTLRCRQARICYQSFFTMLSYFLCKWLCCLISDDKSIIDSLCICRRRKKIGLTNYGNCKYAQKRFETCSKICSKKNCKTGFFLFSLWFIQLK